MDIRNSAILMLFCVAGAIAVVMTAVASFAIYGRMQGPGILAPVSDLDAGRTGGASPPSKPPRTVYVEDTDRILELQTELADTVARLNRQTAARDTLEAQHRATTRKMDQYVQLATELFGEALDRRDELLTDLTLDSFSDDLDLELSAADQLREELDKAALVEMGLGLELTELREQLEATKEQLSELQDDAALEITNLFEYNRFDHQLAASVFKKLGDEAVAELAGMLSDSRPAARRWAAEMLGAIGTGARDAIPQLIEALTDSEQDVTAAARRSIEAIRD